MRTSHKIIAGAALVGLAVAGGAAFTGTGLASTTAATQFIGGTVSQTVTGATLTGINYQFADAGNTTINGVLLTFDANAIGQFVNITLNGAPTSFTCQDVQPDASSLCTPAQGQPNAFGVTGIDVTVS